MNPYLVSAAASPQPTLPPTQPAVGLILRGGVLALKVRR